MLHLHVIGRGTPFTSRLPLVACGPSEQVGTDALGVRYLSGHRDELEKAFLADAFPRQRRSVRPPDDACGHLVDQVAASLSEVPKAFHREGGEF